jgi:hypothetical protein
MEWKHFEGHSKQLNRNLEGKEFHFERLDVALFWMKLIAFMGLLIARCAGFIMGGIFREVSIPSLSDASRSPSDSARNQHNLRG